MRSDLFLDLLRRQADYNTIMNERIVSVCMTLDPEILWEDRGAFFHSIMGTLNHLLVADRIWLHRFRHYPWQTSTWTERIDFPLPQALDECPYRTLELYAQARSRMDETIRLWASEVAPRDLEGDLHYRDTQGSARQRPLTVVLVHFFNHQTHHRGQITTLLSQIGKDVGVTDFIALVE